MGISWNFISWALLIHNIWIKHGFLGVCGHHKWGEKHPNVLTMAPMRMHQNMSTLCCHGGMTIHKFHLLPETVSQIMITVIIIVVSIRNHPQNSG